MRRPHHTVEPWAPAPRAPIAPKVPGDFWALGKQIDELGGEWTFHLFIPRTANFHLPSQPVQYYEFLSDFDVVATAAFLNSRARKYEVPVEQTGSVMVDYAAYPSVFNPLDGFISMPSTEEKSIGRHVAGAIGLVDEDTLLVRHAWSGWTEDGTAKMSREFFETYCRAAMLVRPWDRGPLQETVQELLRTSNPDTFQSLWGQSGGPVFARQADTPWRSLTLSSHPTWSLNFEVPAEVLTLTDHAGVRIGVAVLIHEGDESVISDLFIWPSYRRRGLGTVLEQFAAERATDSGSRNVIAYVFEADAEKGMLRASGFLESRGYEVAHTSNAQFVARALRSIT